MNHAKAQLAEAAKRMEKLLLTPREASMVLAIGRTKVYDLIARGVIPSVRIGRSVRVPAEALREWINSRVAEERRSG